MTEQEDPNPPGTEPEPPEPPKPTGPPPPPPDTLPTTHWLSADLSRGATLTLDGPGVLEDAVDVHVMAGVLSRFERLVRIVRAHKSGLDVKRRGPIVEVKVAPRLVAAVAQAHSYVVPLRLLAPQGELWVEDREELEEAIRLLGLDGPRLIQRLQTLPERAGDEILGLVEAAVAGRVRVSVTGYRDGATTEIADISLRDARLTRVALEELRSSDTGAEQIRGMLFRIDTKRTKIAIDAESADDEGGPQVVEATFSIEMLEKLRPLLRERVELDVNVYEERRPYERSARSRTMSVKDARSLSPSDTET